jgi:putative hemolysin
MSADPGSEIRLPDVSGPAPLRWLWTVVRPLADLLIGLGHFRRIARCMAGEPAELSVLERLNRVTGIHGVVSPEDEARIPRSGSLLVVCNHAYGGADPQVIATLLDRVRPDVRFVANRMMADLPPVRGRIFAASVLDERDAARANVRMLRQVIDWLQAGHCVVVFPAGEVSHFTWRRWRAVDGHWQTQVARVARRTNATVLPIFVDGGNRLRFQLLGLVHPIFRTIMLVREYAAAARRSLAIRLVVGTPIPADEVLAQGDEDDIMKYLRVRTYLLRTRLDRPRHAPPTLVSPLPVPDRSQHEPAELAAELAGLPPEDMLLRSGEFEVWCTRSERIPLTMLEIGRLREISFRSVGEGTGKAIDIDRFDARYHQMLVWNNRTQEVVGGYRLGFTDQILREQGIDGLYTSTLFAYPPTAVASLGPAVELGRSWVAPAWQRKPAPLLLLWKGLARVAVRDPRYAIMFGPVSISDEYQSMSKKLILAFLERHRAVNAFAERIRPRHPPDTTPFLDWDPDHTRAVVRSADDVERIVREIEANGRSVPVLLRQYLKLNAKPIAFNVDPDFGNVVDALMYMDLRIMPPRLQDFYFGEGIERFRAFHGLAPVG